jgi:hypothetical protein
MGYLRNTVLATIAAAATAGSAVASIPAVSVRIEQVGSGNVTMNPTANPVEGGYTYSGNISLWGFQSSFDLSTNTKAATGNNAFGGFFTLKNTTAAVQQFIIDMTITNDPTTGNALAGGSVAGVLLGGPNGGSLRSVASGMPVWSAHINYTPTTSSQVASLMLGTGGNPFSVTAGANQSGSIAREFFGNNPQIPSLPIGPLGTSRTIRMQFLLSGGSEVSLSTNFVVQIPAPGAIALLGLSGLVGRRRRA